MSERSITGWNPTQKHPPAASDTDMYRATLSTANTVSYSRVTFLVTWTLHVCVWLWCFFSVGAVLRPAHHSQLPGRQGVAVVATLARNQAQPEELQVCRDQGNSYAWGINEGNNEMAESEEVLVLVLEQKWRSHKRYNSMVGKVHNSGIFFRISILPNVK